MRQSIRKYLDIIPLLILIISACYLVYSYMSGQTLFFTRHIIGFISVGITIVLFAWKYKIAVLALGFTILLGLFGVLSFSPAISTISFGKSFGENNITLLRFQPVFLLWAIMHFIISGRYYAGILSKAYWNNILSDDPFIIKS
jgi:hypothetical protein